MGSVIGRPISGTTRSADLACAHCGAAFRRKLSQISEKHPPACSRGCAYEIRKAAAATRFWNYVAVKGDSECWEWTGSRPRGAYGHFTVNSRAVKAHRFSLSLSGVSVPDDRVVMHICDNPGCVNPAHLRVGTYAENTRDMFEKGRNPNRKGEAHPLNKLTSRDVNEIRRRRAAGERQVDLACEYGVSRAQIYRITHHKNWSEA